MVRSTDVRVAPVQLRPGRFLSNWLQEYSSAWQLSENETAKRLAALAACGLDVDSYPLILSLTATTKASTRVDFVGSCAYIRAALEGADRSREQLQQPPMTDAERKDFVQQTVDDALKGKLSRAVSQ